MLGLIISALTTAKINYEDRLAALEEEREEQKSYGFADSVADIDEQIKHYTLCHDEVVKALQEVK